MEIYQLKYLKSVVDYQSYSKAADALFVTQPTISIAIRKLEKELQVTLLKRQGKSVVLTDIGERIYPACLRLLRDYESVLSEVEACRSSLQYDIRLAVPFFLYNKFILYSKTLFVSKFPNFNFIIKQAGMNQSKKNISKIDFDLLITSSSSEIAATPSSDFKIRHYGKFEYFAYFSNESHLVKYTSLKPAQLDNEHMLFSKSPNGIGAFFHDYFESNGIRYGSLDHNYPPDVLMNLAKANLGVALMPRQDIVPNDVCFRPLDPPLEDELMFIYSTNAPRIDSLNEIMDYLIELKSA